MNLSQPTEDAAHAGPEGSGSALVVNDDKIVRDLATQVLTQEVCTVATVDDGRQAAGLLER